MYKVPWGGRAGASPEHQSLSEQEYESGFTRLMMSIYNRERIKFSAFISNMHSFMAVLFNSCTVMSLLGKVDGLSFVTLCVRLYFLESSCINCISGIYVIHPICVIHPIRHFSVNPILQNRYLIMVKCLNIGENSGKSIYRSISR